MCLWKRFTSQKVDTTIKLSNVRFKNKTCVIYNSLTDPMYTNTDSGIALHLIKIVLYLMSFRFRLYTSTEKSSFEMISLYTTLYF